MPEELLIFQSIFLQPTVISKLLCGVSLILNAFQFKDKCLITQLMLSMQGMTTTGGIISVRSSVLDGD